MRAMSASTIVGREVIDTKLEKPFRILIGGGSGTGKTTLLKKIIDQNHFSSPFDKIIYCYPEYLRNVPTEFDQIVEYRPGLGDLEYYAELPKNTLIIFDDMMNECGKSDDIMKLFSVVARKGELSIFFLVQNMYDNTKQFRNIRINSTGYIIFNFFAATDMIQQFLRQNNLTQILPKRLLEQIYRKKFAYIFVNRHQNRHSYFVTITSDILEKYFRIFHNMEYIAIPKADFVRYCKIVEAKDGSIRAVKNEIEIKDGGESRRRSGRRSRSRSEKRRRRRRSPTPYRYSSETGSSE